MNKSKFGQEPLAVPFEALAERGFKRLPPEHGRAIGVGSDLEAIMRHPLNFLDDRRCGLLRFAEFEDEMIAFEREEKIFDLFGVSLPDRCLFVGRFDGRVYHYTDWSPHGDGPIFEAINTTLLAFVKSHCMEQSISCRIRAMTAGSEGGLVIENGAMAALEAELKNFIELIDSPALESVYWSTLLYELGDGLLRIVPGVTELLHKGRWPI